MSTIDINDPSSMQDACYKNFVIDLAHRSVFVAQWQSIGAQIRRSEVRFLMETQNFSSSQPEQKSRWSMRSAPLHVCGPTTQRSQTRVATNSSTYREVQRRLFELWEAFNKKEKSLRQLLKGCANINRPVMHLTELRHYLHLLLGLSFIIQQNRYVQSYRRSVIMGKIYQDRSARATRSRLFQSTITFQSYYDLEMGFFTKQNKYVQSQALRGSRQNILGWVNWVTIFQEY